MATNKLESFQTLRHYFLAAVRSKDKGRAEKFFEQMFPGKIRQPGSMTKLFTVTWKTMFLAIHGIKAK